MHSLCNEITYVLQASASSLVKPIWYSKDTTQPFSAENVLQHKLLAHEVPNHSYTNLADDFLLREFGNAATNASL